jgi:hypothetical protein
MDSEIRASRLRRAIAVLAAVAACVFALEATAAPPVAPSPADKETARTLMDEGDDRMEARDPAAALTAYQRADAIMHLPMTGVAVARAQEALGHLREARDAALAVAGTPAQPGEAPAYARARAEAQAIADRVAQRIPPPQGVPAGTALPPPPPLAPVAVPAAPAGPRATPLVVVGFGVGGAGLVVGAVTGALSLSKTSQLGAMCGANKQQCPAGSLSAPRTLANVSNVGFGVGAAGVVAGVVGLVLSRGGDPARPAAALRPLVGPGWLGVGGEL